jgi:ABC-type transporter Mla maintaining outer membrane lipid asymmetry ATPase subunit MlaF
MERRGGDAVNPGVHQHASMARRWGILFQQGALFSSLTVRQNIQFPLRENLTLSEQRPASRFTTASSTR